MLKGLLEDGEILLADGRRFVSPKSVLFERAEPPGSDPRTEGPSMLETRVCQIHPGFRVIALANRPGYPFMVRATAISVTLFRFVMRGAAQRGWLTRPDDCCMQGNDFFAEMGDVFGCHAIDNPDQASEIALLRSYAPNVHVATITRLTAAFMDLRKMTDEGQLLYPYSTLELVNIVLHLSEYPDDSMSEVLDNVLSFDSFDRQLLDTLFTVFRRHGIPVARLSETALGGADGPTVSRGNEMPLPTPELHTTWRTMGEAVTTAPIESTGDADTTLGAERRGRSQLDGAGKWRPLRQMMSSRLDRFTEELLSWKISGDSAPMHMTALPHSMVAILTMRMHLQIADPDNNVQQTIRVPSPGHKYFDQNSGLTVNF
eukprot:COSAG01_NODE_965_length_12401_cov_3.496098_9_plen_373_part_00